MRHPLYWLRWWLRFALNRTRCFLFGHNSYPIRNRSSLRFHCRRCNDPHRRTLGDWVRVAWMHFIEIPPNIDDDDLPF